MTVKQASISPRGMVMVMLTVQSSLWICTRLYSALWTFADTAMRLLHLSNLTQSTGRPSQPESWKVCVKLHRGSCQCDDARVRYVEVTLQPERARRRSWSCCRTGSSELVSTNAQTVQSSRNALPSVAHSLQRQNLCHPD